MNTSYIDRVVFGDNQFFGINHMSQEKAQQQAQRFSNLEEIIAVYDYAYDAGIRGFMLNSNDRSEHICNYFLKNSARYPGMNWYPSIPYPHKYANKISEHGIISTINDAVFKGNSAVGVINTIARGGMAVLSKDIISVMKLLVDSEVRMFHGLSIRTVFLQNILTDLLLGYGARNIIAEYCDYIRVRYGVLPGLITQNMPLLRQKLREWGIEGVVICTSFNRIGYLMSPSIESYVRAAKDNDSSKYPLMAMSSLASGAINPVDAYAFVNQQNIQSVVFGASSKKNIVETMRLISL